MTLHYFVVFCIGAIIGSFLNVVGLRFLREESIVWPGSHCYSCNQPIKPYDNIPILSWLLLRGQCRACKAKISIQYPLIELFTALLFVATVDKFGFTWQSLLLLILVSNFMVILITDFREQYIFDLNSLGLIPFGLVYSGFNMGNWPGEVHVPIGALQISMSTALASSFIAIGGAFTIFFLLNFFSRLVIGRDGFGEGDNRLLMGIGAFFGVKWMIVVFILAFVIQAALGIPFLLWQWLRHKAYSTTALLIGGFSLAVVPYFFQAQLQKSPLLLLGVVSVSGGAAMTCAFKALKQAKSLPTGLMALPFGPAIVVACLAMLFLENPVLPLLTTILHF